MADVKKSNGTVTLARVFGDEALVVHCLPTHQDSIRQMMMGIDTSRGDLARPEIYRAMDNVHGEGIDYYHRQDAQTVPVSWIVRSPE